MEPRLYLYPSMLSWVSFLVSTEADPSRIGCALIDPERMLAYLLHLCDMMMYDMQYYDRYDNARSFDYDSYDS